MKKKNASHTYYIYRIRDGFTIYDYKALKIEKKLFEKFE